MASWNAMPEKIYDTMNADSDKSDEEDDDVPPTLNGDSCKSKWKALLGLVTKFAKKVKGDEGSGSASEPKPPYYDEITTILGNSSAVKGPYSSRNSMSSGRIDRAPPLEPKSDTPMTAFAKGYDENDAKKVAEEDGVRGISADLAAVTRKESGVGEDCEAEFEMVMQEEDLVEVVEKKKKKKGVVVEEEVMEDGERGKKRKAKETPAGEGSGKKAMRKEKAAKELERIREAEGSADESPVKKTPKPAKNKKEAAARTSGGSERGMSDFQSQYLTLMGEANATGVASLAIQKESQATNMESLRQHGLDQDEKRKDQDQTRKDAAIHAATENAKFLALLGALAPSKPPTDGQSE
ncbi:hypothetical protein HDU79_009870 [Rhizoclosmatium sp. JEL0117]|nr:hypothetical protein HDU79_009870 [Rhizoclosmatium sp. JEL0117]